MKINTHGIPMHGLRKASGETKGLRPNSCEYVQISYDRGDGSILTDYHCSIGQNSWTQYHDASIITVCNASRAMTMQQIADCIHERLNEIKRGW